MKNNNMFPVIYNYKEWYEKDCDSLFLNVYHSASNLNTEGGVYLAEKLWVYPDGTLKEW